MFCSIRCRQSDVTKTHFETNIVRSGCQGCYVIRTIGLGWSMRMLILLHFALAPWAPRGAASWGPQERSRRCGPHVRPRRAHDDAAGRGSAAARAPPPPPGGHRHPLVPPHPTKLPSCTAGETASLHPAIRPSVPVEAAARCRSPDMCRVLSGLQASLQRRGSTT